MHWAQNYDPLGNVVLSTTVAALPIVLLLGLIAFLKVRIHFAALLALAAALAVALFVFGMPYSAAAATTAYGAAYGLFPIGWIILNLIFLYQLTVKRGLFDVLRGSLAGLSGDARIQVILIAFCFGAFFEGCAGFGAPVAITAAMLIGLGFKPLPASALSLIANTAPVAFGSLGTPIIALNQVTGLDLRDLSAMVGRQLPVFSIIVPFWVVWAFAGWRWTLAVWPAALTAGLAFAIPQFLISNLHGPWLVDIVSALCSIGALVLLLQKWQPKEIWKVAEAQPAKSTATPTGRDLWRAWMPWVVLSVCIFIGGVIQNIESTQLKAGHNLFATFQFSMPGLHEVVMRVPPVVPQPTPEKVFFKLNWLTATGSTILVAAVLAGLLMRFSVKEMLRTYWETLVRVRYSLITVAAMLALGNVTKYSGTDATLGLALAKTGVLYPFFGTMLGWLGVALTGSDTASNVLFGSLQKITAEQTGLSPTLMAAANSSGGVMGKMIDAQSIVVASTATNWYGHEGSILRYVFFHSLGLAALVGLLVYLQAYVTPFTEMVVK